MHVAYRSHHVEFVAEIGIESVIEIADAHPVAFTSLKKPKGFQCDRAREFKGTVHGIGEASIHKELGVATMVTAVLPETLLNETGRETTTLGSCPTPVHQAVRCPKSLRSNDVNFPVA